MTSNEDVFDAFAHKRSKSSGTVFSDGYAVYSYGYHFPLAYWDGDKVILNGSKYSVTTSKHQSQLRRSLAEHGVMVKAEVSTAELKDLIDRKASYSEDENINVRPKLRV